MCVGSRHRRKPFVSFLPSLSLPVFRPFVAATSAHTPPLPPASLLAPCTLTLLPRACACVCRFQPLLPQDGAGGVDKSANAKAVARISLVTEMAVLNQ